MKRFLVIAMAAVMTMRVFALSLAEASAKIADVVKNPESIAAIMKDLSKEDQVKFLGRVNTALSKTRESAETKTAKFIAIAKAALKSSKGNLRELVAETFATVSPASLAVLNEYLAANLFSRNANPARPISDERMKLLAVETMKVVQARNAGNNNSSVRDVFAILMFLRSAGASPSDLADTLITQLSDREARTLAREDWIPAAMGVGREKSYDPILAACDAVAVKNAVNFLGPEVFTGTLIADLDPTLGSDGEPVIVHTEKFLDPNKYALPSEGTAGLNRIPKTTNPDKPWYPGHEPGGYRGQILNF